MATSEASSVPCSLCDATFANPRELGTHILAAHCGGETSNGGGPAAKKAKLKRKKAMPPPTATTPSPNPPPPPMPPPPMVRAMMVPPPPTWVTLPNSEFTPVPAAVKAIVAPVVNAPESSGVIASDLGPQNPSDEERKQKFMTIRLSEFSSKYICLVCNKAYTSRYNIRMHCNMHTGKNVHRCKFCGRIFAHKHVFESHVRTHTGEKPFACMKCGRSFGDRSNRLSHQKKCTATAIINSADPPTASPGGPRKDLRPVRALPERLAKIPANTQVIPNNNNARYVTPDKIRRRRQALSEVYNDNAEEDEGSGGATGDAGPQIVSVESVRPGDGGGEDDDDEDEEELEEEEIIVDPSTLTDIDYDDIIDDSVYDEDLEEIQIEPDIIDYDGDDQSSSTDTGPTNGNSAAPSSDLNRDVFTCSHCYDKFGRQTAFLSHLVSAHLSSARFEGFDRGSSSSSSETSFPQEDLERGYAVVRYASRVKYLCLSCGKQFVKEEHIGDHIKVHFQDGVYNCLHCDRVFSSYDVYETHVDSHRIHCQHCNDIFPDKESAARHEDECQMNIFGPQQRGKLRSDPGLKECKVVLSRVDDFSNPPKVDDTIVKEEIDDDDDDDEEHELRIDEEEEEEEEDYEDEDGVEDGIGAANSFLTLKPPAAVMNMVNLPPPPPLPPTLHPAPPLLPTLNLRPLAPAPPMPQQIQLILSTAAAPAAVTQSGHQQPILSTAVAGTPGTTPVLISTQPITGLPREPVVIKPVERRRAPPQAKFPTDDFYIPDNNSNNVVNKEHINPPPNEEERRAGFCQRTISDGRQRLICTTCGKHYTTMYNMRQHRNIHLGKGLHTCRYCGKDFTHKHIWETHERIHTGERPFRCPHCPKDFADRSNYNSHRKLCATLRNKISPGAPAP